VTGGPGDVDGDTPQTPDMTCTTSGGDQQHPSTCTVTYSEPQNQGGTDAIRAWIDSDHNDSTVEADMGEGVNPNAPGPGGCAPGTKGAGDTPEPDGTECVERRWVGRVPTTVDVQPKASSGPTGSTVDLVATVLDQFGDPFGVGGTSTTVNFEILAGSAHDLGDGSDFSTPDLGACATGPTGTCQVPFTEATAGTDVVCGYLSGASAGCGDTPDAPAAADGADVVTRTWLAPPPPPDQGGSTGVIPPPSDPPAGNPPAAPAQASPPPEPKPHPRPEPDADAGGSQDRPATPAPAPAPAPVGQVVSAIHVGQQPARRAATAPRRPVRHARRRRHGDTSRLVRRAAGATALGSGPARPQRPAARRPAAPSPRTSGSATFGQLSRAALTTAHKLSFPLALTLLVMAFLAFHGRLDRRDPKLRLAPVDSKHDLVPFS